MALAPSLRFRRGTYRLPAMSGEARLQAVRDGAAPPVVDLHRVRVPSAPDGRNDLSQVVHVAAPVVLRGVPHDEHSLRDLCEAVGARVGRDLQDGVADGPPDSPRADA